MNMIVAHFKKHSQSVLTGFDRIVFKGYLRPFMNVPGVNRFCQNHGILNKDYTSWMIGQTEQIISDATHYAKHNCERGILPISSSVIRKEEMAHGIQEQQGITSGLIGVFSAIEACSSFRLNT